jgi:chromosome segregation ATPase
MNINNLQKIYILELKINKIEDKIDKIEAKIDKIEAKIDKMLEILEKNTTDCQKMSSHIDFIERIYENVNAPMNYICNNVNRYMLK